MAKFYITTAIPYVNAPAHIGHALEFVQTDMIARYHKMRGQDVFLTTGADENSLKSVQAAAKQNIDAQTLCDRNSTIFEEVAGRTTSAFQDQPRRQRTGEYLFRATSLRRFTFGLTL